MAREEELGRELARLAERPPAQAKEVSGLLARLTGLAVSSMREAGARAVASGRWLAEVALEAVPHLPVRDLATLQAHHGGLAGPPLADALVRNASRTTATVGAAAGAVAAAHELVPPAWVALPAEVVVETLAVAAVEMKLVAELHEVYGHPLPGRPAERALALARAWAERRGVTPGGLAGGGLADSLGRSTRREVARLLQRRLLRRSLRNLPTLAPFLVGAVAGAQVNRRATLALGEAVRRDLAAGGPGPAALPAGR